MSEKKGSKAANRDKSGRFLAGHTIEGGGRPAGGASTVKIVGAQGVALGAHSLLGEFDDVMTADRWRDCIEKMSSQVINLGSVRAFDSLWRMKERLMILSGTETVNMDRLLDALENYAVMSDNSNLSDTPAGADPAGESVPE